MRYLQENPQYGTIAGHSTKRFLTLPNRAPRSCFLVLERGFWIMAIKSVALVGPRDFLKNTKTASPAVVGPTKSRFRQENYQLSNDFWLRIIGLIYLHTYKMHLTLVGNIFRRRTDRFTQAYTFIISLKRSFSLRNIPGAVRLTHRANISAPHQ